MLFLPTSLSKTGQLGRCTKFILALCPLRVLVRTVFWGRQTRFLASGAETEFPLALSHGAKRGTVYLKACLCGHPVTGRITAPQRYARPNSQDLWICHVTWQGGINITDGIKAANQLIYKIRRFSYNINPEWAGLGLLRGRRIKQLNWTEAWCPPRQGPRPHHGNTPGQPFCGLAFQSGLATVNIKGPCLEQAQNELNHLGSSSHRDGFISWISLDA